jgi:hypothetical protein
MSRPPAPPSPSLEAGWRRNRRAVLEEDRQRVPLPPPLGRGWYISKNWDDEECARQIRQQARYAESVRERLRTYCKGLCRFYCTCTNNPWSRTRSGRPARFLSVLAKALARDEKIRSRPSS